MRRGSGLAGVCPAGCAGGRGSGGDREGRTPAHSPLWSRPQREPPVEGERAQGAAGPARGGLDRSGPGGRRPPAGALPGPRGSPGARGK